MKQFHAKFGVIQLYLIIKFEINLGPRLTWGLGKWEAATGSVPWKKVFLKISEISL